MSALFYVVFVILLAIGVAVIAAIHAMDVAQERYLPTARQRRQWRRERLVQPNRRRS
jgi:hypothetical protein